MISFKTMILTYLDTIIPSTAPPPRVCSYNVYTWGKHGHVTKRASAAVTWKEQLARCISFYAQCCAPAIRASVMAGPAVRRHTFLLPGALWDMVKGMMLEHQDCILFEMNTARVDLREERRGLHHIRQPKTYAEKHVDLARKYMVVLRNMPTQHWFRRKLVLDACKLFCYHDVGLNDPVVKRLKRLYNSPTVSADAAGLESDLRERMQRLPCFIEEILSGRREEISMFADKHVYHRLGDHSSLEIVLLALQYIGPRITALELSDLLDVAPGYFNFHRDIARSLRQTGHLKTLKLLGPFHRNLHRDVLDDSRFFQSVAVSSATLTHLSLTDNLLDFTAFFALLPQFVMLERLDVSGSERFVAGLVSAFRSDSLRVPLLAMTRMEQFYMSNCLDHVSSAKVTVDEALAACIQCVTAWSNLMFFYCDSVVFRMFFTDEELAHMFRECAHVKYIRVRNGTQFLPKLDEILT